VPLTGLDAPGTTRFTLLILLHHMRLRIPPARRARDRVLPPDASLL